MITSFFQVALECFNRLISGDTTVVELSVPAIAIMVSTGTQKDSCRHPGGHLSWNHKALT